MQHMQKENRRKLSVSAGFVAGAEGLVSAAGSGAAPRWGAPSTDRGGSRDRFAAERHWRSLTPRHAPQAGLRAHLVAKSYRTLTKKSGKDLVSPAGSGAAPWWGAPSTDRGGSRDRFAAERHWRSLTPRHAVLEWMWENTTGSKRGPVLPDSSHKSQNEWCWFGAVSSFRRRIVYRLPLLPSKEKHLRQEDGQADQDHGRVGPGGV